MRVSEEILIIAYQNYQKCPSRLMRSISLHYIKAPFAANA